MTQRKRPTWCAICAATLGFDLVTSCEAGEKFIANNLHSDQHGIATPSMAKAQLTIDSAGKKAAIHRQ